MEHDPCWKKEKDKLTNISKFKKSQIKIGKNTLNNSTAEKKKKRRPRRKEKEEEVEESITKNSRLNINGM